MYDGVPRRLPVIVRWSPESVTLAIPKSVTFTRSPGSIMMLAGFTSRCTTWFRWAKSSASATCAPSIAARSTVSLPWFAMTRSRPTPSMNSMAR